MNLQVLTGLLKRTKMHVDQASSGSQCIEMLGKIHYDMVFLDYRMPHMNGIEGRVIMKLILLVDDDEDMLALASRWLMSRLHPEGIVQKSDGKTALMEAIGRVI